LKEKLKDDKFAKSLLYKFISVLVIAIVTLLLLNVLAQDKDGRSQIVDEDGGTEYTSSQISSLVSREEARLAEILSTIKGVGEVDVMITYKDTQAVKSVFANEKSSDERDVKGVIVTASGASSPVVKNNIMNAVAAVFDIPIQNVMVFEKNEEGYK
jgi:hypothetical protein